MKKKVLIYDSSSIYLNFLEKKIGKHLTEVNFRKLDNIDAVDFEGFDALLFVLNDEKELVDLMWLHTLIPNIIITSRLKKLTNRLSNFDTISLLDLDNPNYKIINNICLQLNIKNNFRHTT